MSEFWDSCQVRQTLTAQEVDFSRQNDSEPLAFKARVIQFRGYLHARRESIRYVVPGIVPIKPLDEGGLIFEYETFPGNHFSGLRFQVVKWSRPCGFSPGS